MFCWYLKQWELKTNLRENSKKERIRRLLLMVSVRVHQGALTGFATWAHCKNKFHKSFDFVVSSSFCRLLEIIEMFLKYILRLKKIKVNWFFLSNWFFLRFCFKNIFPKFFEKFWFFLTKTLKKIKPNWFFLSNWFFLRIFLKKYQFSGKFSKNYLQKPKP